MDISNEFIFVKYPELLLQYQICEGRLALANGPAWKGLWHRSRMEHQQGRRGKGIFLLSAPHSAVQARSYWVFLTLPQLFKTSTSAMEGFCVLTRWSQVTKTLQGLLSVIVSFWFTPTLFWVYFWNLSEVGQSHQLWWYIKPGQCISSSTAFIILPYVLTCAHH